MKSLIDIFKEKNIFAQVSCQLNIRDVLRLVILLLYLAKFLINHACVPSQTETSASINRIIEESSFFPLNIKFSIQNFNKTKQNRLNLDSVMKQSKRRYGYFYIRAETVGHEELGLVFKQDWKEAEIAISKFTSSAEFFKYLTMFLATVENITILNAKIESIDRNMSFSYPKLETLTFNNCSSAVLLPFVGLPNKLNFLKVGNLRDAPGIQSTYIWRALLQNFKQITKLAIDADSAKKFFLTNVGDTASFRLMQIQIGDPNDARMCANIESFLMSQGSTLTEICLNPWKTASTLTRIWPQMKALRILTFQNHNEPVQLDMAHETPLMRIKLKQLFLELNASIISKDFLQFLLNGSQCRKMKAIVITALQVDADILEVLKGAAYYVMCNNEVITEQEYSDDDTGTSGELSELSGADSEDDDCSVSITEEPSTNVIEEPVLISDSE